jgi:ABC-type microcin C transport system duplicated ATPase subunit YejF
VVVWGVIGRCIVVVVRKKCGANGHALSQLSLQTTDADARCVGRILYVGRARRTRRLCRTIQVLCRHGASGIDPRAHFKHVVVGLNLHTPKTYRRDSRDKRPRDNTHIAHPTLAILHWHSNINIPCTASFFTPSLTHVLP